MVIALLYRSMVRPPPVAEQLLYLSPFLWNEFDDNHAMMMMMIMVIMIMIIMMMMLMVIRVALETVVSLEL